MGNTNKKQGGNSGTMEYDSKRIIKNRNKKQGSKSDTMKSSKGMINEQGTTTGSGTNIEFQEMPKGCIANILFFTTPVEACRLALVSRTFCSAAGSDAVWDRFLPSDLESIVSESSETSLIVTCPCKKVLFLTLSDRPILVDHGRKSFQLDKRTGKKCCMIAARDLSITWGDTTEYWDWIIMPESRFKEVAKLVAVCWFHFHGKMNTRVLSPGTQYAVFLVFKMIKARGFNQRPVELSVGILIGDKCCTKKVYLEPFVINKWVHPRFRGLERPTARRVVGD